MNWQRIAIPIAISLALFITVWVTHPFIVAASFLAGAMVYWIGQGFFSCLLFFKIKQKRPQRFLLTYYIGEFCKLLVFAALFTAVALVFRLHLYPMLIGFILNVIMFLLLFIKALGDI